MINMDEKDPRAGYVAGLRALADILEQNDTLPLPFTGTTGDVQWIEVVEDDEDQRRIAQTFTRCIPGTIRKNVRDDYLDLNGRIHGLAVELIVKRDAVCTRVVTGTREVTEEVPDPDALAAVPTVTVTRTVEDVEWDCSPILAEQSA